MTAQNTSPTRGQTRRLSCSEDQEKAKRKKHDGANANNNESKNEGNSPNFYTEDDDGPFRVHIEYVECSATKDLEIKSLTVGQIIQTRLKLPGVVDVKKFGKKTVTIYYNDYEKANQLVSNQELLKYNLKAYVPSSYLLVTGVSRGVDQIVDLEDLKEELAKNFPVT